MRLPALKQAVYDLAMVQSTEGFREMFPELAVVYNLRYKQSWQEILAALQAESPEWLHQIWVVTVRSRQRQLRALADEAATVTHNLPAVLNALAAADPSSEAATAAFAKSAGSFDPQRVTLEYGEAEASRG